MPSWAVNVHVVAHSGRLTSLELQKRFVLASFMPCERLGGFTRVRLPGRIADCLGSD